MKTADLIPFILLELNESDNYGFELTKNIESKSNGKIVIKQPTLYTILKKLEKSKFISSYWQDSEIGGKRHYYKLTENGKLQVSTLPSYEELLKNTLSDEDDEQNSQIENEKSSFSFAEKVAPFEPVESILPTEEVFQNENIDSLTQFDVNVSNSQVLKDESTNISFSFAENKNISKFTETNTLISVQLPEIQLNTAIDDDNLPIFQSVSQNEEIRYSEYVDFRKDADHIKAKRNSFFRICRAFITSTYLLIIMLLSSVITTKTGTSALYYVFFISSIIIALFYPLFRIRYARIFKIKCIDKPYTNKTKKQLLISSCLLLLVILVCVIVNVATGNGTIGKLFAISNFENLYAPVLFALASFVDCSAGHILINKLNK